MNTMNNWAQHVFVLSVLVASALFIGFADGDMNGMVTASHDNDTDDSNITLTVSETVLVTVEPNLFNFSNMEIQSANFTDMSQYQIIIKNDGSANITDIDVQLDTLLSEQDNPLGIGQAKEYAAGRFIWIKNQSSDWFHAGSLTWNVTENAGGKPSAIENEPDGVISRGFYRNATGDYLWGIAANYSSTETFTIGNWQRCNSSTVNSPVMFLKNVSDTGDNRDLSTDVVELQPQDANRNGDWSVFSSTDSPNNAGAQHNPLEGHYIAINTACTKAYIYRFDSSGQFPLAGNTDHHFVDDVIAPSEQYTGRIGAGVPAGIPAGTTNRTTMTVHAEHG